jgi:hypothetical protein
LTATRSHSPPATLPVTSAAWSAASFAITLPSVAGALREDVERYLKNSETFGAYYRFMAVNQDGTKIGTSNCRKMTTWLSDGCGGLSNPHEGAKRVALQACGRPNECKLIYEGPRKIGSFEIEWY